MPPNESTRSAYTWPVIIGILALLAIGVWFIYHMHRTQTTEVGALSSEFMWTLTPTASDTGTTTAIKLRIAGQDVPVRSMPGSCVEVSETHWELLQDELSGVVCRDAAGNGSEIGIFQSGNNLVLKQGTVHGNERTDFVAIQQSE